MRSLAFKALLLQPIRGIAAGLGVAALSSAGAANAIVTISASEVGADVVFSYSGSVNTTGLGASSSGTASALVIPPGGIVIGPATATNIDSYTTAISGPSQIGSLVVTNASSGTGDIFGLSFGSQIAVPSNYSSGSAISGSSTYLTQSFTSLGLTPGTYTWAWGTGPNADSAVLTIGNAPAPGPAAAPGPLPLFGAGAAFAWSRRLRRRCGRGNIA